MREPDAVGVRDHHELRPGAAHGRHRHALDRAARADPARVARLDRLLQPGLRGEALCHGQGPLLVLLVELPDQVPLHHEETGRHSDRQNRDHHDHDLSGQALPMQPSDTSFHGFPAVVTAPSPGVSEV